MATFDKDTCEICGALDGQVFKMTDYQIGLTAPPFHPWCRCCTCPYFADMEGLGERWTRNPDGTTRKVPADMSFEDWRRQFVQGEKQPQASVVPPASMGATAQKGGGPIDVTEEYSKNATPGQGTITQDTGFKPGKHQDEIKIANWLNNTYGGNIKLLSEADALGVKMPDFNWRGTLWELKSVTTAKAADSAVRQALKQIQGNPGGVVLDYGEHGIELSELQKILDSRVKRSGVQVVDIMILMKNKAVKILRYKK